MKIQKVAKLQVRVNLALEAHRLLLDKLDEEQKKQPHRSLNSIIIHSLLLQLVGPNYEDEIRKKRTSRKKEVNEPVPTDQEAITVANKSNTSIEADKEL